MVLTFDHGMQEIIEIHRSIVCLNACDISIAQLPLVVPVGALDNRTALRLLPDQGVVVECDAAHDLHGDPFAVIPAAALEGVRGIHRARPAQQIEVIAIYFSQEQVIYAEGGALVHCPVNTTALDCFLNDAAEGYDVLGPTDAAFLAECLVLEDRMMATGGWVDRQRAVHC